ncbi:glycosyltransferase family 39 protein [Conexibacter sp. DBS9H8]|uniref:glycosyltransferase family 39 protein n=1 Tax=Conexibacter sp. DBS9H8 TaxID=2937801 RepID=UPI00200F2B5E|nr:glycosyltransferase family 39 protein [Conexibacter sp. DBS9H8]
MANSPLLPPPVRPASEHSPAPTVVAEPFRLSRRARARLPFARETSRGLVIATVLLATLIGAAIRLTLTRGLSLDEIRNLDAAGLSVSFTSLIHHLAHGGVTPPLAPILLWLSVRLLGTGVLAVRIVSIIAGVALVPVTGWFAGELYGRRTALITVLVSACAPVLVWYSQEASPYILAALFSTLALIGALRAARTGRPIDWALHTVAATLALWSDWTALPVLLVSELILLSGARERHAARAELIRYRRAWGLASAALLWQLIPLGVLFATQLQYSGGLAGVFGVSASGVSFYTVASNASWLLFGFHPAVVTSTLSAVWPLAMLASLAALGRGIAPRSWLALGGLLAAAVALLVLGLLVPGAFDVRYIVVAAPVLIVLVARLTVAWPKSARGRALAGAVLVLVLAGALVDQQIDPNNPRRDAYGPALAVVRADAVRRATVLYEPHAFNVVMARFAPGLRALPLSRRLPAPRTTPAIFVVTSFQNDPAALALRNREIGALKATRHLVRHWTFTGVQVWWFR